MIAVAEANGHGLKRTLRLATWPWPCFPGRPREGDRGIACFVSREGEQGIHFNACHRLLHLSQPSRATQTSNHRSLLLGAL